MHDHFVDKPRGIVWPCADDVTAGSGSTTIVAEVGKLAAGVDVASAMGDISRVLERPTFPDRISDQWGILGL